MPDASLVKRHAELHTTLDELLACYLVSTKKTISESSLWDLLSWAHEVTLHPELCSGHIFKITE